MGNHTPYAEETQAHGMTTAEIQPAWLTYKEAEVYASLSRTTLWRLIDTGRVRAAKIGKAVRIERESLEEFLRRCSEEA